MPCTWASCVGRLSSHYSSPPGARAATRRPAARPPMSRRRSVIPRTGKNSLSRPTEIPCFRMEQGIGCKLLNSLCDRAQKTAPRGQNRMKFPKFPCYFPCSQGMRGSGRIKSRHALPSRRLTDVRSLDIGRGEFIMTCLPIREHDEHVGFSCLLRRRRSHRDRRCRVAAKVSGTCSGCLHDVRRAHLEVIPVGRSGSAHRLARD